MDVIVIDPDLSDQDNSVQSYSVFDVWALSPLVAKQGVQPLPQPHCLRSVQFRSIVGQSPLCMQPQGHLHTT
eukprot:362510-Amphidinium_carterae.1